MLPSSGIALVWLLIAQVAPAPAAPPPVAATFPYPATSEVKSAFLKQIDRPRVALDAKVESSSTDESGTRIENVRFASEKKADGTIERVPTLLVHPKEGKPGRRPAVIVLHGTGGNKEGTRDWLNALAKRGIIGVAIDARYHGERSGGAKGAEAYLVAITRAWRAKPGEPREHPFYFDTCWDLGRTVDYLSSRDDVDPKRIGMLGISMGGIETWLSAAVDDRVAVAVPAISVQSFRWSLENGQWQGRARTIGAAHQAAARDLGEPEVNERVCRALWNKVIPGILGPFDCPSMLRLFAGRPLLILNGDKDPNCPIGGTRVAIASAREAYAKAGASDRLKVNIAEGVGHTVTPEQRREALDWLERWLQP